MNQHSARTVLAFATALSCLGTAALHAQAPRASDSVEFANWRDVQSYDIGQLREKIMGLAHAIPTGKLGWRPMDGTRSFHDVFAHVAAEGFIEPTSFGRPLPTGSVADFDAEEARLKALPDDQLIAALDRSFENMTQMIAGLQQARANDFIAFFGAKTYMRGALGLGLFDFHEHLGQLVSYARMNKIVPPWSRKPGS